MTEVSLPLTTIGVILVFGLILSILAKRLGQNPVVGFIVSGIILGPIGFGFLGAQDTLVQGFSELGLFVLLFYLGIELSFRDFVKAGIPTLSLALLDLVASALIGAFIALLLGFSPLFSAAIGLMMFSTSSAIVGKFILDRGLIKHRSSQIALAVLILQDFLGILCLVFISSFSNSGSAFDLALTAVVFAGVSFYAVHRLSRFVEQYFKAQNMSATELTLYAMAVGLIVATVGGFLKLNPALGAYFAGFAISELSVGEKIKQQINFSRDFFLLFFFVAFGASLFFDFQTQSIAIPAFDQIGFLIGFSVLLGVAAITVHSVVLTVVGPLFGITNRESSEMAILLSPLGEFVIIIAISVIPLLVTSEALVLAPVAFLVILVTLLLFEPLYKKLDWHDQLTRHIPALAPRPTIQQPVSVYTSESLQWLKSLSKNLLLLLCLVWITFQLYLAIPSLGIPIPFGRDIATVLLFLFFSYVPITKILRSSRKLWHLGCHNPHHRHQASARHDHWHKR